VLLEPITAVDHGFDARLDDRFASSKESPSREQRQGVGVTAEGQGPVEINELVGKDESGRVAETLGSFWRRLPAAALRGLANSLAPDSRWRRLSSSKSALAEEDLTTYLDAPANVSSQRGGHV